MGRFDAGHYAHRFVKTVNRIQPQRLILVKASQFVTGTSKPQNFPKFIFQKHTMQYITMIMSIRNVS